MIIEDEKRIVHCYIKSATLIGWIGKTSWARCLLAAFPVWQRFDLVTFEKSLEQSPSVRSLRKGHFADRSVGVHPVRRAAW